jgi:hypothetical protein
MADLAAALATVGASVGAAIGGPALTSALQNRRDARLRKSINDNIDLVERLGKGPEALRPEGPLVEELIQTQIGSLIRWEKKNLAREVNLSTLAGVVVFLAFTAWIPVVLWSLHRGWASLVGTGLAVLLAGVSLAGVAAAFLTDSKRKSSESPQNRLAS